MRKIYTILLVWLLTIQLVIGQTSPFSASWSFEGNDNGTASNPLMATSSVSYVGVNKFGPTPYSPGYSGLSVNVQNWSTSLCNHTEYIQFSVQPLGTATMSLTTLSFAFSRSMNGPQQISVRSSVDGFGSDLYTQTTGTSYQLALISLANPAFSNKSGSITFRIYACSPISGGATLHLDEVNIGGTVTATPLPVTVLSFAAKSEGDRVQLAWVTTMERNADRFVVERSADLNEYITVGEVIAKGTTDERQNYGLTDLNPQPGVNYYRLKQIDLDGTVHEYKPVSAMIKADEPVVTLYPNPASPDRIHLRLWNADNAAIHLIDSRGQPVNLRLERQPGSADLFFGQPLTPGVHWIDVQMNERKQTIKVLIP